MVHRAQVAHYARNAARWGVIASGVGVDLPKIVAQKDAVVQGSRNGQQKNIDKRPNLRLYRGVATFAGPKQVKVGEDLLESEKIFINAGARPTIPPVPGLDKVKYLTNETIMELLEVPESLVILGGGYIGLEFGQMFARFGSKVTIVQRSGQIVPNEDPEIAEELQKALAVEGVRFLLNAKVTKVEEKSSAVAVSLEDDTIISGAKLLIATGRRPNTEDLGLDKAGIETRRDGTIKVNGKLETNVPGIWALGDIKGGPAFTHISYNDYQIVYANLIEGKDQSIDKRIVPYCVFTDPELGRAGLTEKEARAKGYKLKIGKAAMSHVSRAHERDETAGMMKLVVDASNDKILGATILSVGGGETVHMLYALMLADLPYTFLKQAVYIHPTMAEGLFFLVDAVK
jgi:pyruvate/2-oxoglutarate dehydrogenase complex dihydrolipoamide dehydrogenase (E3) component